MEILEKLRKHKQKLLRIAMVTVHDVTRLVDGPPVDGSRRILMGRSLLRRVADNVVALRRSLRIALDDNGRPVNVGANDDLQSQT